MSFPNETDGQTFDTHTRWNTFKWNTRARNIPLNNNCINSANQITLWQLFENTSLFHSLISHVSQWRNKWRRLDYDRNQTHSIHPYFNVDVSKMNCMVGIVLSKPQFCEVQGLPKKTIETMFSHTQDDGLWLLLVTIIMKTQEACLLFVCIDDYFLSMSTIA